MFRKVVPTFKFVTMNIIKDTNMVKSDTQDSPKYFWLDIQTP